jgi:transcriptional regulator with XRE-family HTH domain
MNNKQLRLIRFNLRLTQEEFGILLGFSPLYARNRVSEMENNRKNISKRTGFIAELLQALGKNGVKEFVN